VRLGHNVFVIAPTRAYDLMDEVGRSAADSERGETIAVSAFAEVEAIKAEGDVTDPEVLWELIKKLAQEIDGLRREVPHLATEAINKELRRF